MYLFICVLYHLYYIYYAFIHMPFLFMVNPALNLTQMGSTECPAEHVMLAHRPVRLLTRTTLFILLGEKASKRTFDPLIFLLTREWFLASSRTENTNSITSYDCRIVEKILLRILRSAGTSLHLHRRKIRYNHSSTVVTYNPPMNYLSNTRNQC